ncbi:hypothetical protein, partial [Kribbella sp. C-35]|uniref:hypothetical protein n=1 Tax=Kribbella sp. C-35 TaxID=2789276 RepID=UPI00397DD61A
MQTSAGTRAGGDHRVTAGAASRTDLAPDGGIACAHCTCDAEPLDDAYVPDDLYHLTGSEVPDDQRFVAEEDALDAELDALLGRNRFSRVDELEWQEWDGVEQDEAEREMLRRGAPAWVFLPPGGALAGALEGTRPEAMSPMALVELMRAADRLIGWGEAIKAGATAS